MGRKKTKPTIEWGRDALGNADFSAVVREQQRILEGIDPRDVEVYLFLTVRFAQRAVTGDLVFQLLYCSWYGLDCVGLSQEFKKKYFELMEQSGQGS